jgi:HAD superfamily hydrolase (TIGR01549 family)
MNLGKRPISAVTFDGDGTLWEVLAAARGALGVVAATLNQGRPAKAPTIEVIDLEAARAEAERVHPDWSMESLRRQSFADVLAAHDVMGVDLDRVWTEFLDARWAHTHLFDDAIPVLRRLRERAVLTCLLSNGNTRPERVGLTGYFDHVQVAEYVGVRKPDPAAFLMAAAALGCAPGAILHVGDDERADYVGAQGAGFRAVLLCRTGAKTADSITSLSAIPDIVHRSHTS